MDDKKQIGPRISLDHYHILNELIAHYNRASKFGKFGQNEVIEMALEALYEQAKGEFLEEARRQADEKSCLVIPKAEK